MRGCRLWTEECLVSPPRDRQTFPHSMQIQGPPEVAAMVGTGREVGGGRWEMGKGRAHVERAASRKSQVTSRLSRRSPAKFERPRKRLFYKFPPSRPLPLLTILQWPTPLTCIIVSFAVCVFLFCVGTVITHSERQTPSPRRLLVFVLPLPTTPTTATWHLSD